MPLRAHVRVRSHAASQQTLVTTDDTIDVVRVQDSFAASPPAAAPQPSPAASG